MNDYELDYIRHVVGKALHDDDRFDPEAIDREKVELALWATTGDIACGLHINHPDEMSQYEYIDPETDAFVVDGGDE